MYIHCSQWFQQKRETRIKGYSLTQLICTISVYFCLILLVIVLRDVEIIHDTVTFFTYWWVCGGIVWAIIQVYRIVISCVKPQWRVDLCCANAINLLT